MVAGITSGAAETTTSFALIANPLITTFVSTKVIWTVFRTKLKTKWVCQFS